MYPDQYQYSSAERPRKKRILVILAITLLLVVIGYLVFKSVSEQTKPASASGIVAMNTGYIGELNKSSKEGELLFFTGSNVGKVSKSDLLAGHKSTDLYKELPLGSVDKLSFDSETGTILARKEFDELGARSLLGLPPGQLWLLINRESNFSVFSPEKAVIDAKAYRGDVYAIRFDTDTRRSLIKYSMSTKSVDVLSNDIDASQVIGVRGGKVIVRNEKETIAVNSGKSTVIHTGTEAMYFDEDSGSLVVGDHDSLDRISIDSLEEETFPDSPYEYIYTSGKSTLVSFDNKIDPNNFAVINLANNDGWQTYSLEHEVDGLRKTIDSVSIIDKEPLLMAVNNAFDELSLIGPSDTVDKVPTFKYPEFAANQRYKLVYTQSENALSITLNSSNVSEVRASKRSAAAACDCDINMVSLVWGKLEPETIGH